MIQSFDKNNIRNIAIIAHVDHGKTTLVDALLKQSGAIGEREEMSERAMDSNDLEKERGITILAKCTAVIWDGVKINVIDTPGHADFGGEVERVLNMVDGVVLLVDSAEGVMSQTRFVLSKALKLGLKPIVVINKIDRQDERMSDVVDEVFDLFVALEANQDQLDFPIIYASGREGYAIESLSSPREGTLKPLFDTIVKYVSPPVTIEREDFSFLGTILESDDFLGRTITGKIYSGTAKTGAMIKAISVNGELIERGKITRVQTFKGMKKNNVDFAKAGDIIRISGLSKASVSDTICSEGLEKPLPSYPIDPPTMSVTITVNTSPFAGQEGTKVTSTMIGARLFKEAEVNVAIKVERSSDADAFVLGVRGELQLGVLLETMRREGFEMSVSQAKVIMKKDSNGKIEEPIEEVIVDVDEAFSGTVIEKMSLRRAEMIDMRPPVQGKTRIIFLAPSRGLIGYRSEFLTDTSGNGVLNSRFHSYGPHRGEIKKYRNGAMVSTETGESLAYSIFNLQDRGTMFISPQTKVYAGMVVGEHNRDSELQINVIKGKQLTNVRASGSDENIKLSPPKIMTLEECISYVGSDEIIEVTPKSIRLRKKYLDPNERKRFAKSEIND